MQVGAISYLFIYSLDFLEPTHNKQDFVNNSQYVKFRSNLVKKLNSYWISCNIDKPNGPGIRYQRNIGDSTDLVQEILGKCCCREGGNECLDAVRSMS